VRRTDRGPNPPYAGQSPSFDRRFVVPFLVHDTSPFIQLYCFWPVQSISGHYRGLRVFSEL
jgi:hypothetical protein